MSEAGKYKRPKASKSGVMGSRSRGLDAPRLDAFALLSQELSDLIRNAADPFELAAHLEALGYNNKRTEEDFNLATPFALARKLFYHSDRRPDLQTQNPIRQLKLGWYQLIMVLTLFSTIVLQRLAGSSVGAYWLLTLGLIIWSVTSTSLIYKARLDLRPARRAAVFSFVMVVGLLGLIAFWLLGSKQLTDLTMAVLWWSVSGCLWLEHLLGARRYWLSIVLLNLAASSTFLGVPIWFSLLALLVISLVSFAAHLKPVNRSTLLWFAQDPTMLAVYAGYGSGLGLLLIKLLQLFETNLWLAGGLLILFLFLAEWLSVGVKDSLAQTMWTTQNIEEFENRSLANSRFSWSVLALFAGLSALLIVQVFVPEYGALTTHFALFGLAMCFALMLFLLNNILLPSLLFVAAGVLSLSALPFIWILVFLALGLVFLLSFQLAHVEDYGFYIIG